MRKLAVFNSITVDGYFTDANGDMRWAHNANRDDEWDSYVNGNAGGGGALVFGRKTYDLMASYWPTPMALRNSPEVAQGMNEMPKFVFSRTMDKASWSNTTVMKGDLATEIRALKEAAGPGLCILGSGSIVAQLAPEGLIDEYQFVVTPVALGSGRTLFEGVQSRLSLQLTSSRTFRNGNVLLCYEPL